MTDIVSNFASLSFTDIVKKVLALVETTTFDVAETIAVGLLDAVKFLLQVLKSGLNKEWDIPLLAPLYKTYIAPGSVLSILDAMCLIAAIPATVAYQLAMNEGPFSEDEINAITNAPTWQALLQIFASYRVARSATPGGEMDTTGLQMADGSSQPPPQGMLITSYVCGFVDAIGTCCVGLLEIYPDWKAVTVCKIVGTSIVAVVCIVDESLYASYLQTASTGLEFGLTATMVIFEVLLNALELYKDQEDVEKLINIARLLLGMLIIGFASGLYVIEEEHQDEEGHTLNALKLSQNVLIGANSFFYFVLGIHVARLGIVIAEYVRSDHSSVGTTIATLGPTGLSKAIMHRNR